MAAIGVQDMDSGGNTVATASSSAATATNKLVTVSVIGRYDQAGTWMNLLHTP
jgi:hypothetical protein